MILGGLLMLPITFLNDPDLRVSKTAVGIFAVAILVAGFSCTAVLTLAVPNLSFQRGDVFLPALAACVVGFLTIFYDFLISSRYEWNVSAYLVVTVSVVGSITYTTLFVLTQRKISALRTGNNVTTRIRNLRQPESHHRESEPSLWQDPAYYENYVRNMFPTATAQSSDPQDYDTNAITEEEMQRQQMLMLLLQRDRAATPDSTASTFRIDWQQGRDDDDRVPPPHGYYAPSAQYSPSTAYHSPGVTRPHPVRQWTNQELRPWDGVWRAPAPSQALGVERSAGDPIFARTVSDDRREERRREIEMGR